MGELNRFTTMHTDIDHNSKETNFSVMFFNVPSDIMTEMLSLSVQVLTNSDALKEKNID